VFGSRPDWEDGTEYGNHVLGSCGEASWHKWRGKWWPAPLNEFKKADAEGCIQIRTTPRARPFFKVKPKEKDRPEWMVVFIIGGGLKYEIVGCMNAGEAQQRYAPTDPGGKGVPCHQVPLRDMYSVKEFVRQLDNPTGAWSRCWVHGDYPGEGNCPKCEQEQEYLATGD